jgi:hypothetical protein
MSSELECEDCGSTENLTEGPCPYDEEIHGIITICVLCENCYNNRCQDI